MTYSKTSDSQLKRYHYVTACFISKASLTASDLSPEDQERDRTLSCQLKATVFGKSVSKSTNVVPAAVSPATRKSQEKCSSPEHHI